MNPDNYYIPWNGKMILFIFISISQHKIGFSLPELSVTCPIPPWVYSPTWTLKCCSAAIVGSPQPLQHPVKHTYILRIISRRYMNETIIFQYPWMPEWVAPGDTAIRMNCKQARWHYIKKTRLRWPESEGAEKWLIVGAALERGMWTVWLEGLSRGRPGEKGVAYKCFHLNTGSLKRWQIARQFVPNIIQLKFNSY